MAQHPKMLLRHLRSVLMVLPLEVPYPKSQSCFAKLEYYPQHTTNETRF